MKHNNATFLSVDVKNAQLVSMLTIISHKLMYDPEFDFLDADPEEEKEFSEYRKTMANLFKFITRLNVDFVASAIRAKINSVIEQQKTVRKKQIEKSQSNWKYFEH